MMTRDITDLNDDEQESIKNESVKAMSNFRETLEEIADRYDVSRNVVILFTLISMLSVHSAVDIEERGEENAEKTK